MVVFIYVVASLISGLIFGFVCEKIANPKNIHGFLWGFFLGVIGVIVVFCLPPQEKRNKIVYEEDEEEKSDIVYEEDEEENSDIVENSYTSVNYEFKYDNNFLVIYFSTLVFLIMFVVLLVMIIK